MCWNLTRPGSVAVDLRLILERKKHIRSPSAGHSFSFPTTQIRLIFSLYFSTIHQTTCNSHWYFQHLPWPWPSLLRRSLNSQRRHPLKSPGLTLSLITLVYYRMESDWFFKLLYNVVFPSGLPNTYTSHHCKNNASLFMLEYDGLWVRPCKKIA